MTPDPALVAALLVVEGAALATLLRAGRRYVRGELARARRLGRKAGLAAAAAGAAGSVAALAAGASLAAGALVAASGASALLGGLSGKPRPAGEIAALLFVAGLAALVAGR